MIPRPCARALPLLGALLLAACGGEPPRQRPSFLLISLDTCRADALGFMGAERPTPALDRFAASAAVFEDCMAQSSITAPSHMSLFTGYTVQRHGLLRNGQASLPRSTLAGLLGAAGYRTAAFTGHGSLQAKYGHAVGFDEFVSLGPPTVDGEPVYQRKFEDTLPEARAWLDRRAAEGDERPFLLLVHGYDPHLPYWPAEELRERYGGWYDGPLDLEDLRRRADFWPLIEAGRIGPDERRLLRDLYDAELFAADALLGAFLGDLEARGLLEATVVVFTSDHGELLGEHEWVGHGLLYEEVARVPLFLRFPGGRFAGRYDAPVQHVDVLPTLLSLAGVPTPGGVQGQDLMPLLRGEGGLPPDRMRIAQRGPDVVLSFADAPDLRILGTVRKNRQGVRDLEVYDLASDPGQGENLLGRPELDGRVEELVERYLAWSRATAGEDAAFREVVEEIPTEDLDMLRALGYLGEDEDPGEPDDD